jgi:hypothetical protein
VTRSKAGANDNQSPPEWDGLFCRARPPPDSPVGHPGTLRTRLHSFATKAKMAQRIVRSAHEGITDAHKLVAAAVAEGMVPAL